MNRGFWHGMDPVLCLRDVSGHPLYGFGFVRKKALVKILGRALALMAMLASCVFAVPALAFAAEPTVIEVGSGAEFDNAVATINGAAGGDYVIKLTDDFESGGASFSSACATTILGGGHTITLPSRDTSLFVQAGSQLNLGSADGSDALTIKGGSEQNNDAPGLLYVQGACSMYSGVTVSDREGNNYFGGGVTVEGGTFHMYGGTIKKCGINGGSVCYGGGVGVIYGGSFVMDAGEITGCYAISPSVPGMSFTSFGGGVFVMGGSFVMNGGTISDNRADMGGGVMLYGNSAVVNIEGGTITGNTATMYGGGLAAVRNSGAVVVSNTKLCNNVAGVAASDVYLNDSPAKLSSAKGMGERYLGKPDDETNKRIDGWYLDDESPRYVDQSKDGRQEYLDYADIDSEDEVCLIAATSGSLSEFYAKYEFRGTSFGMSLPDSVLNLMPKDANTYATGDVLSAIAPAKRVVEVSGGTWTFKGYERESVTADATTADSEGNVTFVGVWEFAEKISSPSSSGNGGKNGTNDAPSAGAEQGGSSSGIPQTGDAASAALYLVLIASAASLLSARLLSRR